MYIRSYYLQQLSLPQLKARKFKEYGIISDNVVYQSDFSMGPIKGKV